MIFRRTCIVASALIMLGTLGAPSGPTEAQARRVVARDGNVLTGELVIIKGTRNRFRLVGHGGTFAAPAGTSLEPFDGKPVEVEFGRGGTVLAITEEPVHIEPITHGFEVVTGELIVNDPVTGTFSLAGADRVYIAPAATDIRPYAGRMVNVRLDERGRVMGIDAAAQAINATSPCTYGGYSYTDGESVYDSGPIIAARRERGGASAPPAGRRARYRRRHRSASSATLVSLAVRRSAVAGPRSAAWTGTG